MKKYLSWLGLLPITIIVLGFLKDDDLNKHTEKTCFGLLLSLITFVILYIMLIHFKLKKWVALIIASILYIISFFIKMKIYK